MEITSINRTWLEHMTVSTTQARRRHSNQLSYDLAQDKTISLKNIHRLKCSFNQLFSCCLPYFSMPYASMPDASMPYASMGRSQIQRETNETDKKYQVESGLEAGVTCRTHSAGVHAQTGWAISSLIWRDYWYNISNQGLVSNQGKLMIVWVGPCLRCRSLRKATRLEWQSDKVTSLELEKGKNFIDLVARHQV